MAIDPEQLAQAEDEEMQEEDDALDEQQRLIRRRRRQTRRAGFPWLRWIRRGLAALLTFGPRR